MSAGADFVRGQLLGKFGFTQTEGAKHEKYRLEVEGQYVAHTLISRGHAEISNQIMGQMARQLRVTAKQFRQMLDCTMSRDDYLDHAQ